MDRLRWGNIARALALLGVVGLVAAWPHLRGRQQPLPSGAPAPVTAEDPLAQAPQGPAQEAAPVVHEPAPVRRARRRRQAKPRAQAPRLRARHAAGRRRARPGGPAPRRRAVAPAWRVPAPPIPARPAPTASDRAAREFALP